MKKYLISVALGLSINAFAQNQGMLTHQQAIEDICNMMYTVSEVHPNMYGGCNELRFHSTVDSIARTIPDSIGKVEFYQKAAQIMGMLNDSHSVVLPPMQEIFTADMKFLPLQVKLEKNKKDIDIIVDMDFTDSIPDGAKITSINGISANEIACKLTSFFSSKPDAFELNNISQMFHPMFEMMYSESIYNIVYMPKCKNQTAKTVHIKPLSIQEYKTVGNAKLKAKNTAKANSSDPYSYRITDDGKVAILSFRSCVDEEKMASFADDLVKTLKNKKIEYLIIDVTENGGGSSNVGAALLQRICPKPFGFTNKMLERLTPTSLPLLSPLQATDKGPGLYFSHFPLIDPLPEAQRFNGKVYLLTSSQTFSSASMFANTFKEFGCGMVIGEETGGKQIHYGDYINYILLNSGLTINISHKMFWEYGADEKHNHGTLPDVKVAADKALDKALEIIKNGGKVPAPAKSSEAKKGDKESADKGDKKHISEKEKVIIHRIRAKIRRHQPLTLDEQMMIRKYKIKL